MFRTIGIILIFFISTLIGFYQSSQLSRRKVLLTEFRNFLESIDTEMAYFKEPVPNILQKLHQDTCQPVDILIRQCLLHIGQGNGFIDRIWKDAVNTAYENEPMKTADINIISKCGSFIGQSDYLGQKGHFELLKDELSRQIQHAEEDVLKKGPLYSKAGVSIGAVLAIALL